MRPITLVALAPLVGATDLLVKAMGLGLVALPLFVMLGALAALMQRQDSTLRRVLLLVMSCAWLSIADLLLQAWALELRAALGIFLPLLLVALVQPPPGIRSGLRRGLLFSAVALLLGALRECLGNGTLLSRAEWLFGPAAGSWTVHVPGFAGVHLFALAPGAFILSGMLWALARSVLPATDSKAR